MTDKEYFIKTVADEAPRFVRVYQALQAVPADKLDYKPDPKAKSASQLAYNMASECLSFGIFLKTGIVDLTESMKNVPKSIDEAVAALTKGFNEGSLVATGMTDADWASPSKMVIEGKDAWVTTKGDMALSLVLDLVHHRGQLSTYIRPMGGKVPSIYGPSADSGPEM